MRILCAARDVAVLVNHQLAPRVRALGRVKLQEQPKVLLRISVELFCGSCCHLVANDAGDAKLAWTMTSDLVVKVVHQPRGICSINPFRKGHLLPICSAIHVKRHQGRLCRSYTTLHPVGQVLDEARPALVPILRKELPTGPVGPVANGIWIFPMNACLAWSLHTRCPGPIHLVTGGGEVAAFPDARTILPGLRAPRLPSKSLSEAEQ
mmetsp:Transcript_49010/g.79538  ORF Transcript_49010/g.79538 Transcript_49010/m.79538 type:complete len:208 (-) Transcript_49010:28-651(-)